MLSSSRYHVLHFDLRIAGFADLAGLYLSMNKQMEQYFNILSQTEEGYQEFEKEAWAFKVRYSSDILVCWPIAERKEYSMTD